VAFHIPHQDLLHVQARRVKNSSNSSREFSLPTGVSIRDLPFANREIRTRGFASSTLTISTLQFPSPSSDGQRSTPPLVGDFPIGISLLAMSMTWSSNLRTPMHRLFDVMPPVLHYISWSHAAHVTSGFRGSRIHDTSFPCCWKPRTPNPDPPGI
jgi:hypothetical protein